MIMRFNNQDFFEKHSKSCFHQPQNVFPEKAIWENNGKEENQEDEQDQNLVITA